MKHHRSPYKKKRSDSSGFDAGRGSPARTAARADRHPDLVRQPSGEERRDSRRHRQAETDSPDRDFEKHKQREPSWQRQMRKKLAEAAKASDRRHLQIDATSWG